MKIYKKIYVWLPLLIAVSIALGIYIGNMFSPFDNQSRTFTFWKSGDSKLDEVLDYINKAYVDSVNSEDLIEKAIPAMIAELDPHSTYISAEDMEYKGEDLEGHFGGIGVEFMIQYDTITIVNVVYGGPSEAVGIQAGDRIVSVNDTSFVGKDLSNEKVLRRLRGKKDTKVKLGISRHASDTLHHFTVTRADVPVNSVETAYMVTDDIGYIKVRQFASNTHGEFISALAKLKRKGSKSFIIDLQENAGGYMGAAVMMLNEFLDANSLILYTEGRTHKRENIFADGSGSCKDNQLVVLIDEASGSSSEIFAGTIQDHDRGLIVGRRSFGKGLVQNRHVFADGSALQLTIARYYVPSGRCLQKSYVRGKGDEYNKDIYNRYMRGEFDNRDSIKVDSLPLFHTTGGRPVYGNDGVLADVFVPRDTVGLNSYCLKVINSGTLREYAFEYVDKNRSVLKSLSNWQAAREYLASQPIVEGLVVHAEKKGIRRRPYLIAECRSILQTQLEALIIRNAFGEEGFYPIFQRDDVTIKKAIELLQTNKAEPKAIAKEAYK